MNKNLENYLKKEKQMYVILMDDLNQKNQIKFVSRAISMYGVKYANTITFQDWFVNHNDKVKLLKGGNSKKGNHPSSIKITIQYGIYKDKKEQSYALEMKDCIPNTCKTTFEDMRNDMMKTFADIDPLAPPPLRRLEVAKPVDPSLPNTNIGRMESYLTLLDSYKVHYTTVHSEDMRGSLVAIAFIADERSYEYRNDMDNIHYHDGEIYESENTNSRRVEGLRKIITSFTEEY